MRVAVLPKVLGQHVRLRHARDQLRVPKRPARRRVATRGVDLTELQRVAAQHKLHAVARADRVHDREHRVQRIAREHGHLVDDDRAHPKQATSPPAPALPDRLRDVDRTVMAQAKGRVQRLRANLLGRGARGRGEQNVALVEGVCDRA